MKKNNQNQHTYIKNSIDGEKQEMAYVNALHTKILLKNLEYYFQEKKFFNDS
jgi:hypothetical protein